MDIKVDFLLILQLGTALFWIITYILIIRRGFQDKTYGMPMVALCSNICWEFIFSFVYPHQGLQRVVDITWLLLDIPIMLQLLRFGRKEFAKFASAKYFYPAILLALSLSFLIIMSLAFEFGDFEGKYAAFGSNLMMSVMFVALLLKRRSQAGQSIYIAISKMIGSLCASMAFWLYYNSFLINILSFGMIVFDLMYIVFIYNMFYKVGVTHGLVSPRLKEKHPFRIREHCC